MVKFENILILSDDCDGILSTEGEGHAGIPRIRTKKHAKALKMGENGAETTDIAPGRRAKRPEGSALWAFFKSNTQAAGERARDLFFEFIKCVIKIFHLQIISAGLLYLHNY